MTALDNLLPAGLDETDTAVYSGPIVTRPLISWRLRRSASPAALGRPYFREARG